MKLIVIAAVLITLPAIVVIISFFGSTMMFPALASFAVNMLPFAAFLYLLRNRKGKGPDLGH